MLQNLFSFNHNFSITLSLTMVRFPYYPQNVFNFFFLNQNSMRFLLLHLVVMPLSPLFNLEQSPCPLMTFRNLMRFLTWPPGECVDNRD